MIWKTLSLSVLVVTAACGQPSEQVEAKSEAKATVVEAASKAKEAAPPKQPSKRSIVDWVGCWRRWPNATVWRW